MLATFHADLHLHTCLSPCAEEEMGPLAIVRQAKKKGLDVIGICDHNSAGNVAAVRQAGRREGLAVIGGVEVCSEEEVHILGLFDEQESLLNMQRLIEENLHGENNPELFGQQSLCDQNDAVVARETRLLIGATELSVDEVVEKIHQLGGLAVASHVDRESFSLFSQLGFVPRGLQIDALEISPLHSVAEAGDSFPQTKGYRLVSFSDAHRLEEIGTTFTTFRGISPSVKEFRKALLGEDEREILN
ncbi:MAG: PHP domain-containing protein [Planctomycetes bacterium]|nr:PHP domain-containing protein [Planctomycetota bacterium]